MTRSLSFLLVVFVVLAWLPVVTVSVAQEAQQVTAEAEFKLPEIAEDPKTIDPATLMPAELSAAATVDLSDSSLAEVVAWLRNEQKLIVLLNSSTLSDINMLPSEPMSDRLDNEPIYLLLNRLRSLGLAWYFEDGIVHITSMEDAEFRLSTQSYNVGDLLDAGYEQDDLARVIESVVSPESWESVGGPGALTSLGDVMFIRQTDEIQRETQGLLTALRGHARQTFVLEPTQHQAMRQKLDENVSVDFLDTPLVAAVRQLAEDTGVDLRLDMPCLRDNRIREREPVTLKLTDRTLATVLQAIAMNFDLTWILRDGVLWITSPDEAELCQKIAVYDVRDLCRDKDESDALSDAVVSQAEPESWEDVGGPGTLIFAKPGTMVVRNEERVLMDVFALLESYRAALRASKPRDRDKEDAKEVITVYYRLHANVAASLQMFLPMIVKPDSWKIHRPTATGTILNLSSLPDLSRSAPLLGTSDEDSENAQSLVISRAVLIITQTREVHEEIAEVIRRVETGDPMPGVVGDMGTGMGGMGGFGGGFMSVPAQRERELHR
jgi:hypothetical protein